MDRTAEAGKSKGGGVCFMTNKKWCDPGISPLCRDPARLIWNIYPLSAAILSTPRVLRVIATAVYIPPQADTSLALSKLHDVLSGFINKHPDAAFIIAGDFNKPPQAGHAELSPACILSN